MTDFLSLKNPLHLHWQNDKSPVLYPNIFEGCRQALSHLKSHLEYDKKRLKRTTIATEVTRWIPDTKITECTAFLEENMKLPSSTVLQYSNKSLVCCLLYWLARFLNDNSSDIHYYWFERSYEML